MRPQWRQRNSTRLQGSYRDWRRRHSVSKGRANSSKGSTISHRLPSSTPTLPTTPARRQDGAAAGIPIGASRPPAAIGSRAGDGKAANTALSTRRRPVKLVSQQPPLLRMVLRTYIAAASLVWNNPAPAVCSLGRRGGQPMGGTSRTGDAIATSHARDQLEPLVCHSTGGSGLLHHVSGGFPS